MPIGLFFEDYNRKIFFQIKNEANTTVANTSLNILRYGDMLNPWGDLIAMAKAWCLSKPTGKAVIGIPVGPRDKIVFNSHKTYGPIMRSHLFANWKLEYTNLDLNLYNDKCDYCYQPIFLLSKAYD